MAPRKKTTDEKKPRKTTARAVRKTKAAAGNGERMPPSGKGLVIVESPAKAKTIKKYLGPDFEVAASYGHVRDLPPKPRRGDIGIDIEAGWVPTYINLDDDRHKKVLSDLKKYLSKVGIVYLAPDPDREG